MWSAWLPTCSAVFVEKLFHQANAVSEDRCEVRTHLGAPFDENGPMADNRAILHKVRCDGEQLFRIGVSNQPCRAPHDPTTAEMAGDARGLSSIASRGSQCHVVKGVPTRSQQSFRWGLRTAKKWVASMPVRLLQYIRAASWNPPVIVNESTEARRSRLLRR